MSSKTISDVNKRELLPGGVKEMVVGIVCGVVCGGVAVSLLVGPSVVVRRFRRVVSSLRHGRRSSLAKRRGRVICFGDSITQFGYSAQHSGWVGLLSDYYSRKLDVVNRGFSGYNTKWLRVLVPDLFGPDGDDLRSAPPVLVTIFLGANDAVLPGMVQHVPLEEYKHNLRAMATAFVSLSTDTTVLLLTPPPLHEDDWNSELKGLTGTPHPPVDRSFNVTRLYGEAVKEVGAELGLTVVDVHRALGGHEGKDGYRQHLCDGLHLNASGNALVFKAIVQAVKDTAPWLEADNLPMQAPQWSDINDTLLPNK